MLGEMAIQKDQHFKRNIEIAATVIFIALIVIVAGFISGLLPIVGRPLSGALNATSNAGHYLLFRFTGAYDNTIVEQAGNESRIFLVSANASYGRFPYDTRYGINGNTILARHGEPCIIIDVTIRNDYSTQYPAPFSSIMNLSLADVTFTAQLFSGEKQVNTVDLLQGPFADEGGAMAVLPYGESGTFSLYIATNNYDITSFQIVPWYIGGFLNHK